MLTHAGGGGSGHTAPMKMRAPHQITAQQLGAELLDYVADALVRDNTFRDEFFGKNHAFFRAQVTAVQRSNSGLNQVRIQKSSTGKTDNHWYPVYAAMYVPKVGDDVVMAWLDHGKNAVVIGGRSGGRPNQITVAAGSGSIRLKDAAYNNIHKHGDDHHHRHYQTDGTTIAAHHHATGHHRIKGEKVHNASTVADDGTPTGGHKHTHANSQYEHSHDKTGTGSYLRLRSHHPENGELMYDTVGGSPSGLVSHHRHPQGDLKHLGSKYQVYSGTIQVDGTLSASAKYHAGKIIGGTHTRLHNKNDGAGERFVVGHDAGIGQLIYDGTATSVVAHAHQRSGHHVQGGDHYQGVSAIDANGNIIAGATYLGKKFAGGALYEVKGTGSTEWTLRTHDGTDHYSYSGNYPAHRFFNGGHNGFITQPTGPTTNLTYQLWGMGSWGPGLGVGSLLQMMVAQTHTAPKFHYVGDDNAGKMHAQAGKPDGTHQRIFDHDGSIHNQYSGNATPHKQLHKDNGMVLFDASGNAQHAVERGGRIKTTEKIYFGAQSMTSGGDVSGGRAHFIQYGYDPANNIDEYQLMRQQGPGFGDLLAHAARVLNNTPYNTPSSDYHKLLVGQPGPAGGGVGGLTAHALAHTGHTHPKGHGFIDDKNNTATAGNMQHLSKGQHFKYVQGGSGNSNKYTWDTGIYYGWQNQNHDYNTGGASEIFFVPQATSRVTGYGAIKQYSHSLTYVLDAQTGGVGFAAASLASSLPAANNTPGGSMPLDVSPYTGGGSSGTPSQPFFKTVMHSLWYTNDGGGAPGIYSLGVPNYNNNYGWGDWLYFNRSIGGGYGAWSQIRTRGDTGYTICGAALNGNTWSSGNRTTLYMIVN